ncbi:MAG: energy-coupling factor ABC transporter ATP-binding protein [Ignavibacteria bacterium]|nr:energy-coupling factor ABC transporter ATP-binding protein [Ignavibacteria bacterium]
MTPAIEVRNLSFTYPDGKEALRNVNLTVQEKESIGLIGPNGSGKSTLLLHLNGILPERHDGNSSVLINGEPVSWRTLDTVRRQVGLLFQDPDDQIFCPTVFEDVAFGPQQFGLGEEEVHTRVRNALGSVGLEGFEHRLPHHLSGGEKQRVCLAGILACSPTVLVLDEPTSGLDPRGKRELTTLLQALPVTKVIATHDLELVVRLCARTIVLDRGEVIGDGRTTELLSDEQLMLDHGLEKPHILQHRHPHG